MTKDTEKDINLAEFKEEVLFSVSFVIAVTSFNLMFRHRYCYDKRYRKGY